jgi:hypothetical protein
MQQIQIIIENYQVTSITDQAGQVHYVGGLNPQTALATAQQVLIDATTPPAEG